MTAGIWVKLDDGREFDSSNLGVTFIESFEVDAGRTGSKSYPEMMGIPLVATSLITNSVVVNSAGDLTPFDRAQTGTLNIRSSMLDGVPTIHWDRLPTYKGWSNVSKAVIFVFSGKYQ